MDFNFCRNIAVGAVFLGACGVVAAQTAMPVALPSPVIHDLGKITATTLKSFDFSVGSSGATGKTNQFDVFTFSLDYPAVTDVVVKISGTDYGANENGNVQYNWGMVGDEEPESTSFQGLRLDLVAKTDGAGNAVFSNYRIDLPPQTPPATGTYWLGIWTYADHTTYTLSMAPVPEPESYALLLSGLGMIGFVARRRKINNLVRK